MRRGLMLLAAALTLGGCGAGTTPSPPEPRVVSIVQDDAELLHRSPEQIAATLDDLRDLGVDWVRVTAGWSVIAPDPAARTMPAFEATDPEAYPDRAWEALDRVARETEARGMRLNIDVAFWAPRWAVARPGGRATTERDGIDAAKLADFAEAVARRYPQAAAFTVWNEPNHNAFLLPQWERRNGGWVPASPHAYRRMLEAVVPRLKAAAPDALVLIGATSSVGSAVGEDRSERMSPLTFTRELACVDEQLRPLGRPECADFRPLPGDGFSHHPYALDLPPWAHDPRPETARIGDLDRMTRLLAQLHQRGRTEHDLPLYLTEFGYQTNPPDPTWDVTLEDQARWLPEAERIARGFPSARGTAQFTVRDLPERPGPDLRTRWRDYQAGLRFEDGRAKPAHAAYAMSLTARRELDGVRFWGLVRSGEGERPARVSVLQPDGSWRVLFDLTTREDGTFERTAAVDPAATFRLESDGAAGPPLAGAR
ncbi:MAG: cellulase family glycosylhydrolase [Solirubrobacterales bacterium]|nr:cellulase family glycosylhydrolase [Solirubrobacterales bacterium]